MSKKLSPKIINWLEVNVPGKPWIESFELFKQEFPDFPWTLDNMKWHVIDATFVTVSVENLKKVKNLGIKG
ncbi:hypothetical protein [Ligilactobacillus salivarius]|uniref:hypothetical protein n=1 Tax=Ligilactobacillus salivarius TaxID=1624 RepID=UPI001F506FDD|nr:hypothetical protein [Ligilactobacillus salivarius]